LKTTCITKAILLLILSSSILAKLRGSKFRRCSFKKWLRSNDQFHRYKLRDSPNKRFRWSFNFAFPIFSKSLALGKTFWIVFNGSMQTLLNLEF